ncbi:NucA/NucB deoxyribonuclease domain-containing protein [Streptomyces sp. NPDC093249]|uniref:NucA/NucB deoxyribonuclease domain-containing protein n=1 Tax=unclassified Streptomyces TaxID=2593676 RepID=UPI00344F3A4E
MKPGSLRKRRKALFCSLAALLFMAVAIPASAAPAESPSLTVDTYVLPLGKYQLGEQRRNAQTGLARVKALAVEQGNAQLARETVGPAARYGKKSTRPSVLAAPPRTASSFDANAPAALSYPDPARAMTGLECRTTLGSSSNFFLKSRFAICSGASFLQTWLRNGTPVGESVFDVVVVGTIPLNSRQITVTYYVMNQRTTGTTGAAAMGITLKASIAASWPSNVAYSYGGTLLPATRTWASFQTANSVATTLTAPNGVGSNGPTESIAAVYQPAVSVSAPAPWKLGGSTGGNVFMLAPRWDKASYLPSATGAAAFSYLGVLYYSKAVGSPERAVALHIEKAYLTPGQTQPPSSTKKIPGQSTDEYLTRLYNDNARRDRNRSVAVSTCVKYWGPNYAEGGKQCDEFPFASTYQGAAGSEYDVNQLPNNFSALPLDGTENGNAGTLLSQFYSKYRVIDGPDDGFLVQITG